jgi:phosphate-selective porin
VIQPWTGGNDGWVFNSANAGNVEYRPQLRVYYEPGTALLTPVYIGSSVQLTLSGTVGRRYSVERAAVVTGPWSKIAEATIGGSGTATVTDSSPLAKRGYYRVSWP